jgi:hypothetical protein
MARETVQLYFSGEAAATAAAIDALAQPLPGLRRHQLGRNLDGCWGAGTFTLDLWWERAPAAELESGLARLPGFVRADRVVYDDCIGGGLREPALGDGIWRTLLLRVRPQAPAAQVRALEQELLAMPAYMGGIRNWRLSRVTAGSGGWTHVWQQEYARLDDLLGEYLMHPYHWGWVDRWFDPEFPEWTVETGLCHAFCPLPASVLAWDA